MMFFRQSINSLTLMLGAVLIALVVTGPAYGKTFDRVVAKVNEEIITLSAVEERVAILMDKFSALEGANVPPHDELMRQALDMMVAEKLQIQDGQKRGFDVEEENVLKFLDDIKKRSNLTDDDLVTMLAREGRTLESYKRHIRRQIMVSKVMKYHMAGAVDVSKKEIKKYYDQHIKDYWLPPKIQARHILLIIDDKTTAKHKRLKGIKAREILKQIRAGKDFSELAKKYSEDVSASTGGDIGIVEKGKMVPAFEKAVYQLRPGEVSDVVQTRYGLHIIKNEKVIAGHTLPLADVAGAIEEGLAFEKKKKKYDDWVAEMKKAAYIEISLEESPKKETQVNPIKKKQVAKTSGRAVSSNKKQKQLRHEQDEVQVSRNVSEKTEHSQENSAGSDLNALESRLKHYKKLRDDKKITETEYQKKKTELLNRL